MEQTLHQICITLIKTKGRTCGKFGSLFCFDNHCPICYDMQHIYSFHESEAHRYEAALNLLPKEDLLDLLL